MRLRLFTFLLVCTGWLSSCAPPEKRHELSLEDFDLLTLDGQPVDIGILEGKTVFINVWATWCRPCVQEMPTIAMAMEALKGKDIIFLFASNEEVEEITAFRDRKDFPFDYIQLKNLEELSIEAIPTTFIFNSSGKKIYEEVGFRNWSTAESLTLITQAP